MNLSGVGFLTLWCMAAGCGDAATGSTKAKVVGTLTLPGTVTGKPYGVRVLVSPTAAPVAETSGLTAGSTTLPYSISDVPAGTYFVVGFVDVDGSGVDASTPGDYAGWYGRNDGDPPAAASAEVPGSGTVTLDWTLVLRP